MMETKGNHVTAAIIDKYFVYLRRYENQGKESETGLVKFGLG